MTDLQKETSTQTTVSSPKTKATTYQTVEYLTYFFFGALEILLAFRLIFKLAGASLSSSFIGFIYALTEIFVSPFVGIFRRVIAPGAETKSILEPETIVAILIYAVIALGIIKLIRIFSGEKQTTI